MEVPEYEYNKLKAEADELDQALGQLLEEVRRTRDKLQYYKERGKQFENYAVMMFRLLDAGVHIFSGNPSEEQRVKWVEAVSDYLHEVNGVY